MGANMRLLHPDALAEPLGLYSHGSLISRPANLLQIAGQLAVDRAGALVGPGDFEAQMRQVFANLGHVLEDADMQFANVLKFTTYLVNPGHIESFYACRAKIFQTIFPTNGYPPNTLLVVQRLVRPEIPHRD